jgi:hypothetical protein
VVVLGRALPAEIVSDSGLFQPPLTGVALDVTREGRWLEQAQKLGISFNGGASFGSCLPA